MATAQQKAARKKKRTAKHVLEAKEKRAATDEQQGTKDEPPKKKRQARRKHHVKDPNKAAAYLSSWKYDKNGWKFNKNTQSWLLRHAYQAEKVSKATFTTLLEYLKGLKGQTRIRVAKDAKRRALRYKEYEKSGANSNDNGDKKRDDAKDSTTTPEDEDDESRWKRLDDHDKRKEYKRARKVLDVLKDEE